MRNHNPLENKSCLRCYDIQKLEQKIHKVADEIERQSSLRNQDDLEDAIASAAP